MARLTDEQITRAREVDLLTYLSVCEPAELRHTGNHEYRTVTHGSLVILPNYWYWNKQGIGGSSALDYLITVRGMPFADAVHSVLGAGPASAHLSLPVTPRARAAPKKADFSLPQADKYGAGMVSYLQSRYIHPKIISRCMQMGILYESRYKGNAVCVFVGKDEHGIPRFAGLRGIDTDIKKDVAGSDKKYSFYLPAKTGESKHLAVFEAPIDALSHATLQMSMGWDWSGYRLSLGGTSPVALLSFLERRPEIMRVMLYLDNDPAGLINARRIKERLSGDPQFSHIRISINPPHKSKDYNEQLQNAIHRIREQRQADRSKQAVVLR
jgi:hypothetical protein